jgi:hypothetical protein
MAATQNYGRDSPECVSFVLDKLLGKKCEKNLVVVVSACNKCHAGRTALGAVARAYVNDRAGGALVKGDRLITASQSAPPWCRRTKQEHGYAIAETTYYK